MCVHNSKAPFRPFKYLSKSYISAHHLSMHLKKVGVLKCIIFANWGNFAEYTRAQKS